MERKLVRVERGNVVLRVPEDDVQRYLDNGFNVLDKNGNVVQSSIPRDVGSLQQAFIAHTNEIKRLKNELKRLQEQYDEQVHTAVKTSNKRTRKQVAAAKE